MNMGALSLSSMEWALRWMRRARRRNRCSSAQWPGPSSYGAAAVRIAARSAPEQMPVQESRARRRGVRSILMAATSRSRLTARPRRAEVAATLTASRIFCLRPRLRQGCSALSRLLSVGPRGAAACPELPVSLAQLRSLCRAILPALHGRLYGNMRLP